MSDPGCCDIASVQSLVLLSSEREHIQERAPQWLAPLAPGSRHPLPKSLKAVALWRPPGPTLPFSPNYKFSLLLELGHFGVGLQGGERCPASFLFLSHPPSAQIHSPAQVPAAQSMILTVDLLTRGWAQGASSPGDPQGTHDDEGPYTPLRTPGGCRERSEAP